MMNLESSFQASSSNIAIVRACWVKETSATWTKGSRAGTLVSRTGTLVSRTGTLVSRAATGGSRAGTTNPDRFMISPLPSMQYYSICIYQCSFAVHLVIFPITYIIITILKPHLT